ncbi:MAG: hypothetical protein AB1641_29905 [Thermodesulfobacteriota bacterium]
MKNEIVLSPQLGDFIRNFFEGLLEEEKKLQAEKETTRKSKDAACKREKRKRDKRNRAITDLHKDGFFLEAWITLQQSLFLWLL